MKTLFLECNMGAAGDMLMAALSELLPAPEEFADELRALNLPGVGISREYAVSAGIRGARMHVWVHGEEEQSEDVTMDSAAPDALGHDHGHHHHHTSLAEIRGIIGGLALSDKVKTDALAVYTLIAAAESMAHGCTVEEVHLHEVGAMDALTDIVGVALLMEKINADKICCSPVNVGGGMVRCAHGILPVPTPATASILEGIPCYGHFQGELCTPTGAALLKHFGSGFGDRPLMTTTKIGVGLGAKEFPAANMLRAFLGEDGTPAMTVAELSCNLDDCTGEELGFAFEMLLKNGALDVFMTPVQMKKSRPGTMLTVISKPQDAEKLTELMLCHTTTLGVRRKTCSRTCIRRTVETRDTRFGPIRVKVSRGNGVTRAKAEYEDVARIALEQGISLRDVHKELRGLE